MSSGLELAHWRITEFSLSMKHLSALPESWTHFANRLNLERLRLHEALETLRIHHAFS
jgi:hypothetical protein